MVPILTADQVSYDNSKGKEIGKGNFSLVYKGIFEDAGGRTNVALKVPKIRNSTKELIEFMQQISLTRWVLESSCHR